MAAACGLPGTLVDLNLAFVVPVKLMCCTQSVDYGTNFQTVPHLLLHASPLPPYKLVP